MCVYPFGSPRVGDIQFQQKYLALGLNDKTYRVVNNEDIAARLPPGDVYTHVGHFEFIDAAGLLHIDAPITNLDDGGLPDPTTLQAWEQRLKQRLDKVGGFASSLLGHTIPAPIANHAPIYYASYIWNNQ